MTRTIRLIALLSLLLAIAACQDAPSTRTPEEVLASAQAAADMTLQATQLTPEPSVTASATPEADTATPEPTATATIDRIIAVADYNAFVREGPDETFTDIDFFLEGQQAEVVGRFENPVSGTWFLIQRIDAGRDGWVWSGAVTLNADPSTVPEVEAPATPEP
ncbi:MAG: SH3 domain-containing protein [Anaerolineales bacterium]|jgi:hypothetical protein